MTSDNISEIDTTGMGGFLNPPSHPEHSRSVVYGPYIPGWGRNAMALSSALTSDEVTEATRDEVRRLLSDWEANTPALDTRESVLWLTGVMAYFKNCYRSVMGEAEPECWYAGNLHIHGHGFGLSPCTIDHPIEDWASVNFIRKFYPDFTPEGNYSPNCQACGHHINAHANGDGGVCTVITSDLKAEPRTLCNCPSFEVSA